ncbi:MAG: hypothetical protein AAGD00_06495 [Planctomycetota bacterium]
MLSPIRHFRVRAPLSLTQTTFERELQFRWYAIGLLILLWILLASLPISASLSNQRGGYAMSRSAFHRISGELRPGNWNVFARGVRPEWVIISSIDFLSEPSALGLVQDKRFVLTIYLQNNHVDRLDSMNPSGDTERRLLVDHFARYGAHISAVQAETLLTQLRANSFAFPQVTLQDRRVLWGRLPIVFGYVLIPIGLAVALVSLLGIGRSLRLIESMTCRTCGYDIRGILTGQCPECGNAITYDS